MNFRLFLKKTKKIRIGLLLTILLICLGVLIDKRRTESALVSAGSELAGAIWALTPYLPPGDQDQANVPRSLEVKLPDGSALKLDFRFEDRNSPWPSRLRLIYYPDEPAHADHKNLEIIPPGENKEAEITLIKASDQTEAGGKILRQTVDALQPFNEHLSKNWPKLSDFSWKDEEAGLQMATAYMRYGPRLGGRELRLVRFDPDFFDFKPWHEQEFAPLTEREQMDISGWAEKLPFLPALINGGQYQVDRSYIGWLRRDGSFISAKAHRNWSGYFVSRPTREASKNLPSATIVDLEEKGRKLNPKDFENIMQSLMLRDAGGNIRVNNSFHLASRAAIGEDESGRILFIMNPGAISLHDLALVLGDPALNLKRVLCLDGGFEAQILRRSGEETFMDKAQYLVFPNETIYSPHMFRTLPSIIGAVPKENVR